MSDGKQMGAMSVIGMTDEEKDERFSVRVLCTIGRSDIGGKIKKGAFTYSDTLFPLYFSILRQVCFLAFFDLRTPSFANFPDCVYIADLHGEVGQNILGGQKNILTC